MKLTKLQAVNRMLTNIGQAPVNSLDSVNPQIAVAITILDEVTHDVQSEGWTYNTEYNYPFNPSNGYIELPDNVLSLDDSQYSQKELIQREGKLYDKKAHAYVNEPIELHVVWSFEFTDLPEVFKNYITIRSANLFAGRSVGSKEAVQYSQREEGNARAAVIEYETQQGDYNMLAARDNSKVETYLPFNVINRG